MRSSSIVLTALVAAAASCSPATVDQAAWRSMSAEDRLLYVRSLIGEEQAKHAKGGQGLSHLRPAQDYVTMIDAAYMRGDVRPAQEIFRTLGTAP